MTGTGVVSNTPYNGEKDITVLSEGKYDAFTVTDMRGFYKTYSLIVPG